MSLHTPNTIQVVGVRRYMDLRYVTRFGEVRNFLNTVSSQFQYDAPLTGTERHLGCSYRHRSAIRSFASFYDSLSPTRVVLFLPTWVAAARAAPQMLGRGARICARIYRKKWKPDKCNLRQLLQWAHLTALRDQERNISRNNDCSMTTLNAFLRL